MIFVTGHVILLVAIATVSLGVARLVAWSRAHRLRRLDSDYRAFAMIAQAKRQVCRDAELERAVCALEVQWGVRRG
ncbi:hypothetical protein ISN34_12180 [Xanthomonas translucens pv. translucens]|uniref:Uncharacterized protein n=2 Tax=Xanthomonas campestris pv. translucens TaxID=343 RepID=A0A125PUN9_XANCT|nr:hypothetical protein [Xanthomonas translucens]KWV10717.1 hypothetical protein ATB53_20325 [Xanthomonas translucens]QSQ35250.1 hypothetical protein ISN31_06755 [Xanthomonas translucens pv. translucens]QSQ44062.1 hypothetical protein ISN34_12180 [Xanthomonas translucens pv. translucens]UII62130.1 hypothetical protein LZE81_09395 [Xanthomonas translucens]